MSPKTSKPLRTCIGCSSKHPQNELIRIFFNKDQTLEIQKPSDKIINHQRQGRSIYLCPKKICLQKAINRKPKNGFSYALKKPIDPLSLEKITSFAL
ncbi:TPA: DUF448 domain-containing protein [Candidatus Peregrinibacteria bacterium]|nr:DUF448 domain-containing protein [Candidatus Peregrinibacteria bacterium]